MTDVAIIVALFLVIMFLYKIHQLLVHLVMCKDDELKERYGLPPR